MILMDYLMYYPLVDEGTTDEQFMDNTNTLTRYTDGEGVQVMAVSVAGRTGGQSFFINYTNQDGVAGRISKNVIENTSAALGVVVTSATATNGNSCIFIPLQDGDTGVRSIESVTMLGTDVGLFSLVLVKPLVSTAILEITAVSNSDYLIQSSNLPEIKPDAFLNFVCLPNGALNATGILADMKVIWSS
jgi:cyclophilin family peptidyl-prolyl cis-trans isomerase